VEHVAFCTVLKLLDERKEGIREGKFGGWNSEPVDKFRRF
jgi:hypothetical protein